MDRGVDVWGLANPSFTRIFLTWQNPLDRVHRVPEPCLCFQIYQIAGLET